MRKGDAPNDVDMVGVRPSQQGCVRFRCTIHHHDRRALEGRHHHRARGVAKMVVKKDDGGTARAVDEA
jgi:hypothetical protein